MLQLSQFLNNHVLLATALAVVMIAIALNEFLIMRRGGKRLAPADAVRLINDRDAVVLDLRAVADFKRGHILAAQNVPVAKLPEQFAALRKHKDKPLILCCALGSVAAQAGIKLRAAGFEEVYPMAGGINAWQNAGLPLTSK